MMDNIYFYYTKEDFDLEKFERIKLRANRALKGVHNWPRLSTSVYNSNILIYGLNKTVTSKVETPQYL